MDVHIAHEQDALLWDWPLQHTDGVVKLINDDTKFEVALEAHQFTPNEIKVKVIGDMLDIHFEHEPRKDSYGDISRSVKRTYKLPKDVDPKTIKSALSNRGTLVINAEKKH